MIAAARDPSTIKAQEHVVPIKIDALDSESPKRVSPPPFISCQMLLGPYIKSNSRLSSVNTSPAVWGQSRPTHDEMMKTGV